MSYSRRTYTDNTSTWKADDINNLQDGIDECIPYIMFNASGKTLSQLMEYRTEWYVPFLCGIEWNSSIAPDGAATVCIGMRKMLIAFSSSGKRYKCTDATIGWELL